MSTGVVFEEEDFAPADSFRSRRIFGKPTSPSLVRFICSTGVVKDEKKAGNLLFILALIGLLWATYSILSTYGIININRAPGITYKEDLTPEMQRTITKELYDQLPSRNAK